MQDDLERSTSLLPACLFYLHMYTVYYLLYIIPYLFCTTYHSYGIVFHEKCTVIPAN
jgi:hypothetical protein